MIHLHTHSMYSLRDSIIRPDELASRLQELGQDAVAITDHGGSLGGISLYKKLKKAGIKYIHGCELYVCDDVSVKDKNNRYYHLVALCKDDTGRLNLNKLISMSEHPDRKYYKPRVDFAMLQELGGGMIFMSACLAGEVSRALLDGDYDKAKDVALQYKAQFGEDYYLEIQSHRDADQEKVNSDIVRIAHETGISLVVTTDAHYLLESDKDYQNKYAFNGSYKEDGEAYVDCFIQTEDEVRARLQYLDRAVVDEAISNTHKIADRCNVEMPLSAPIMPKVDVPEEYKSSREWLESLCEDGFKNKLRIDELEPEKQAEYRARCKYELDSLERMGFLDYILLVYSYANVARRRGIARGSGGGSLVCFLTNITNIDPVEHGLYFERFIDVGAIARLEAGEITAKELKIPDIDLDFGSDSCNEVLRFLYDKYGEENVASIGKFGNNHTNGTIRDMCRVLNIDLKTTGEIAAAFENYEIEDLDKLVAAGGKVPDQAKQALRYAAQYPDLFRYVRKLNGLPKSFGLHSCGKILSTRPLDLFLPSSYDKEGIRYLQGDMHDVEDVGLVKIDVLGLRTVDQMYDTMEMLGEPDESIDPKRLDYTDPKVLDVFKNGNTVGIFQFSSGGMRKTLQNIDPTGIDDLSIANALFRPGSMAYIDSFCRRRRGEEECSYIHPDLEPILRSTYGIIVFQEQLIEIGRMAGMRNSDSLRRATAKKSPELLAQIKPELSGLLFKRGWTQEQFEQLWADMLAFASYSFNKCITGNTIIMRAGVTKRTPSPTIREMYGIMNDREYAHRSGHKDLRKKYRTYGYGNALSMYEDGRIRKNNIVDIRFSGMQPVYTVRTSSGGTITCTNNHKFPTTNGIRELKNLSVGDKLYLYGEYEINQKKYNFTNGVPKSDVLGLDQDVLQHLKNGPSVVYKEIRKQHVLASSACENCGCTYDKSLRFELHHKDKDRTNNSPDNLLWCCNSCHKTLEYALKRTKVYEKGIPTKEDVIVSIEYAGIEDVYDIEMADPAHNFITDSGLVTSNSHSQAYAIIGFLTAKQKAYHPAEFFAGLCNSYLGQSSYVKDDADEIISDMLRMGVKLAPFDFRQDHRRCWVNSDGQLEYAIPLIRDCSDGVAQYLYEIRDNQYDKFWKLVFDVNNSCINQSQIEILIQLGFFNEFGPGRKLWQIFAVCQFLKFGAAKKIAKDKIDAGQFLYPIVERHSKGVNDKGVELKGFQITDMEAILNEAEDAIMASECEDLSFQERIKAQQHYLGFISMNTGKEEDRRYVYVKAVRPAFAKKTGRQFGTHVITRSIGSGKESLLTIMSKDWKDEVVAGDILYLDHWTRTDRGYFNLDKYRVVL